MICPICGCRWGSIIHISEYINDDFYELSEWDLDDEEECEMCRPIQELEEEF